jgi:hypothetical protein
VDLPTSEPKVEIVLAVALDRSFLPAGVGSRRNRLGQCWKRMQTERHRSYSEEAPETDHLSSSWSREMVFGSSTFDGIADTTFYDRANRCFAKSTRDCVERSYPAHCAKVSASRRPAISPINWAFREPS